MSGTIPQSFISNLTDRIDLYTLINARVPLKKSGNSYKACCPFHEEKTPSFNVQPEKGYYHCFGCGAHGDAISFLRDYDNLSFVDAIEALARIAGLEVPRDEQAKAQHDHTRKLIQASELAQQYFRESIQTHSQKDIALSYLQQRGISADMIERYDIGFAPPENNGLYLKSDANTRQNLFKIKLVGEGQHGPYDLFRNRLMFPIKNTRGQVIAFGGRTLGDDKAKYINSPESPIFHKSNEVYGLYEARKANRQLNSLIVVEGYLDAISLAQYGIGNGVATLGTATNQENLTALLRHTQQIVFCFDGDEAGRKAAQKAMENALPLLNDGVDIRFLLLPQGEDPDTLVRKEGGEAMQQRINNARPLSSFFIDIYSAGLDLQQPEHKGIFKKRTDEQVENIASDIIKKAIKSQIFKLTSSFQPEFQGKWQKGKPFKKDFKDNKFGKPKENTGYYTQRKDSGFKVETGARICLGLYFKPALKDSIAEKLQPCRNNPALATTFEFIDFLQRNKIDARQQLLAYLATHPVERERFKDLFNSIEHIPEEEAAILDAHGEANQQLIRSIEQKITEILSLEKSQSVIDDTLKQELKDLYVKKQSLKNLNGATS